MKESFLGFSLLSHIKNYDLIFGLTLASKNLFVNTSLTAIFCLFSFYYILLLIFIPKPFYYLQVGITVLFSGFTSNFINKLSNGYVLDFISWHPFQNITFYFNLADIFQTLAWLFILIQIFSLRKLIWRKNEKRTRFFIKSAYQFEFIGYASLAFFCLSAFLLLISYQYITFMEVTNYTNINEFKVSFLKYSFVMLFALCFLIGIFFLYFSNKIYGPLYAFEKYIKALIKGDNPKDLQFRKNDQLKHLEGLAQDIKKALKNKFYGFKESCGS